MRLILSALFAVCLVTTSCFAVLRGSGASGTDWTSSEFLVALYNFESSGIEADSSGNGNNIDDATTGTTPDANTTWHIEGSQSAQYNGTDSSILTMGNASADFPGNGTGDGEFTIACWIYVDTISANDWIFNINDQQYLIAASPITGRIYTGSSVYPASTLSMSTSTAYFIALSYSSSAGNAYIYVREYGSGSSTWNATAKTGTVSDASSGSFFVGSRTDGGYTFQGSIDALAVFNGHALTQEELDGVFKHGWDGNGW